MANILKAKKAATSAMVALHCIDYGKDINSNQQLIKDARQQLEIALAAMDETPIRKER